KFRVLRHEAQRANLAVRPNLRADLDDASEPDRHVITDANARSLDDALFDGMTRQLNRAADYDIVAAFEQVVVADRQAVDVHLRTEVGPIQSQMHGPEWGASEERSRHHARNMNRCRVANPP